MANLFYRYPEKYTAGLFFSLSPIYTHEKEARQAVINLFDLYIVDHSNDVITHLVTHLDWPTHFGALYGYIPPMRKLLEVASDDVFTCMTESL